LAPPQVRTCNTFELHPTILPPGLHLPFPPPPPPSLPLSLIFTSSFSSSSYPASAKYDPADYANQPWQAAGLSTDERVELLINALTLEEKLVMTHGVLGEYTGNVPTNERVGIPSLNMQDGPQGFRDDFDRDSVGKSTAWPSALTVAATFDTDLMYEWTLAMGEEFRLKGANVALAPGVNLARVPVSGPSFLPSLTPFLHFLDTFILPSWLDILPSLLSFLPWYHFFLPSFLPWYPSLVPFLGTRPWHPFSLPSLMSIPSFHVFPPPFFCP
jgi:hypothetical protein